MLSEKEITQQEFFEEIDRFNKVTTPKIIQILEETQHDPLIEVVGLVSIIGGIAMGYDEINLIEVANYYLSEKLKEQEIN